MIHPLLRSCAALWLTGLCAMWVARALFALEVTSLPFQLAAGAWSLGGLGYVGLALGLCCGTPRRARAAHPGPR